MCKINNNHKEIQHKEEPDPWYKILINLNNDA